MNESVQLDIVSKSPRQEIVDGISHVVNDRGHSVRSDYVKMRELDLWRCQYDDDENQVNSPFLTISKLWKIKEAIGTGTQGCVFRIKLREPDFEGNRIEKALKVVSRQQTYSVPRRLHAVIEALLLGIVSPHGHIDNVYEAYVHQNVDMSVLDLITFDRDGTGGNPRQANLVEIDQHIANPPAAASFLSQLVRILGHMHTRKIVHNNLQASNILVANLGRVVAISFGNAVFDSDSHDVMDLGYEQDWLHAWEGWHDLFELGVAVDGRLNFCGPHLPSQDLVDADQIIRSLVAGHIPDPCFEELASLPYLSGWHLDCPEELHIWPTIR